MSRKSRKQCINCEYFSEEDCASVKAWKENIKNKKMSKLQYKAITYESTDDCLDFKKKVLTAKSSDLDKCDTNYIKEKKVENSNGFDRKKQIIKKKRLF